MPASGRTTRATRACWTRATSRKGSRRPPRSATTASRSRRRARWCRNPSPTAAPRSACAGSSAAWRPAGHRTATRSARERSRGASSAGSAKEKSPRAAGFFPGADGALLLGFRSGGGRGGLVFLERRQDLAVFRGAQLLADARLLAGQATQVVQLGAAHVALALDLDRGDRGRIGLERTLHALAAG